MTFNQLKMSNNLTSIIQSLFFSLVFYYVNKKCFFSNEQFCQFIIYLNCDFESYSKMFMEIKFNKYTWRVQKSENISIFFLLFLFMFF